MQQCLKGDATHVELVTEAACSWLERGTALCPEDHFFGLIANTAASGTAASNAASTQKRLRSGVAARPGMGSSRPPVRLRCVPAQLLAALSHPSTALSTSQRQRLHQACCTWLRSACRDTALATAMLPRGGGDTSAGDRAWGWEWHLLAHVAATATKTADAGTSADDMCTVHHALRTLLLLECARFEALQADAGGSGMGNCPLEELSTAQAEAKQHTQGGMFATLEASTAFLAQRGWGWAASRVALAEQGSSRAAAPAGDDAVVSALASSSLAFWLPSADEQHTHGHVLYRCAAQPGAESAAGTGTGTTAWGDVALPETAQPSSSDTNTVQLGRHDDALWGAWIDRGFLLQALGGWGAQCRGGHLVELHSLLQAAAAYALGAALLSPPDSSSRAADSTSDVTWLAQLQQVLLEVLPRLVSGPHGSSAAAAAGGGTNSGLAPGHSLGASGVLALSASSLARGGTTSAAALSVQAWCSGAPPATPPAGFPEHIQDCMDSYLHDSELLEEVLQGCKELCVKVLCSLLRSGAVLSTPPRCQLEAVLVQCCTALYSDLSDGVTPSLLLAYCDAIETVAGCLSSRGMGSAGEASAVAQSSVHTTVLTETNTDGQQAAQQVSLSSLHVDSAVHACCALLYSCCSDFAVPAGRHGKALLGALLATGRAVSSATGDTAWHTAVLSAALSCPLRLPLRRAHDVCWPPTAPSRASNTNSPSGVRMLASSHTSSLPAAVVLANKAWELLEAGCSLRLAPVAASPLQLPMQDAQARGHAASIVRSFADAIHTAAVRPGPSLPVLLRSAMLDCSLALFDHGRASAEVQPLLWMGGVASPQTRLAAMLDASSNGQLAVALSQPPRLWADSPVQVQQVGAGAAASTAVACAFPGLVWRLQVYEQAQETERAAATVSPRKVKLLVVGGGASAAGGPTGPPASALARSSDGSDHGSSDSDHNSTDDQSTTGTVSASSKMRAWPSWSRALPLHFRLQVYTLAEAVLLAVEAGVGSSNDTSSSPLLRCMAGDDWLLFLQFAWCLHCCLAADGADVSRRCRRPRSVLPSSTRVELRAAAALSKALTALSGATHPVPGTAEASGVQASVDPAPQQDGHSLARAACSAALRLIDPAPSPPIVVRTKQSPTTPRQPTPTARRRRGSPATPGSRRRPPQPPLAAAAATRSHNRVIASWLEEEGGESDDDYEDLADFIVE